MTDYLPLLTRAVGGLGKNPEGRRAVYDRARSALLSQLRSMNPPLAEAEITRERLALEEAIRRIEGQSGKDAAPAAPASAPTPPPPRPQPSAANPARAPAPPVAPPRERAAEPVSGSRVLRDAAADAQQLGNAASQAARAARDNFGSNAGYELESAEPMAETRPRPGGAAPRADPLGEPLQPRPTRGRSTQDVARADARKALKARLLVGGIVAVLLGVATLIGYVHRDRIMTALGLGAARTASQDGPKISDRVGADPKAPTQARAPTTASQPGAAAPAAAVAQRAVLYEENPGSGGQQLQTFVGTAVWKTETVNPGPGRPPELGLRLDVEVPDRKMTVTITIRRNPDQTLPASHTVEVQFQTPGDPFGGVANLPGIRAKTTETAQGAPLTGLVVRVIPGYFLIGLSAMDADREQNLSLLRERGWLDIPFVYNNGRRAVLVIEKGTPGERAVNEVIAAWGG
jgi:hypothetical protein